MGTWKGPGEGEKHLYLTRAGTGGTVGRSLGLIWNSVRTGTGPGTVRRNLRGAWGQRVCGGGTDRLTPGEKERRQM